MESMLPILFSHLGVIVEVLPSLSHASFVLASLGFLCDMERVLDLSAIVDILVVLEYDVVIESGVRFVILDPSLFQIFSFLVHCRVTFLNEFGRTQIEQELLVLLQVAKGLLVLLNSTFDS